MTPKRYLYSTAFFILGGLSTFVAADAGAAQLSQALGFKPIQAAVEYTMPTADEAAGCTIKPEKEKNVSAWVVRNREGEILRRFADTNGDNVVDLWCYYLDGLEVYRDIDSDFNHKADQYRWFHSAGTRWGMDENEDGRIDSWREISPHEVAEQVVLALKGRDPKRFELLLVTPAELGQIGFGTAQAERVAQQVKSSPSRFSKLLSEQKVVSADSRFVDFGSARPARIPADTGGSTKDVVLLDNATALVEAEGKHEQVFLGTLVAVGNTWKIIDVPAVGSENQPQDGGFLLAAAAPTPGNAAAGNAPNEEMQQLMTELEQLYRAADSLPADQQAANIDQRAEKLTRLAQIAPEAERDQWYRQLAGMISVAIQSGSFPQGFERLDKLQQTLADAKASDDLLANVAFQRMWAEYVLNQREAGADPAKNQEKWLGDLQAFVAKYPKSPDAAEALLQLGMYLEFVGKVEEATKWYQQLVGGFPKAESTPKATGALRRLGAVGKPMRLRGANIQGGLVDLAGPPYRGKVVLIHYWATWCEPCKADMVLLKDLRAKRSEREFDIIGVCLDDKEVDAKRYLSENRFPWKHVHEPGGLDSRLANEMGVMTLPLMVLVDQKGNVAHHNIHVGPEIEAELTRLIPPAAATATTSRNTTGRR